MTLYKLTILLILNLQGCKCLTSYGLYSKSCNNFSVC